MTETRRDHLQRHALTRAFERYGLVLGFSDLREIANRIAGGGARPGRQPHHWYLWWRGREVAVVYDPRADVIATFLEGR